MNYIYGKEDENTISYQPLWETMKERGVSTYRMLQQGIDRKTLHNLKNGQNITLLTAEKLCRILHCGIADIVEFVDDAPMEKQEIEQLISADFQ